MSKSKGNVLDPLDLDRRRHARRARRKADREHARSAAGGVDREAHAQAVPGRHSELRRRRAALHVREPCDLRPHAQFRPLALRRLPQFLQQAVERDAIRADERRGPGLRARSARVSRAVVRRPLAARPIAAGEARHRGKPRHLSLRPRGPGALRVRLGRVLRLVPRVREGPAASGRRERRRGGGARDALGARARAGGDPAARASVHAVHHGRALADGGAARRQVGRDDLAAAVSQGEFR